MNEQAFYKRIKEIIETARQKIVRAVNVQIVQTYWLIGHEIVEEEQRGKRRVGYGVQLLKNLSERLTADFGSGFDESNLRNIRHFYAMYPNRDALRHELSWTHYRILMRVENPEARSFKEGYIYTKAIDKIKI